MKLKEHVLIHLIKFIQKLSLQLNNCFRIIALHLFLVVFLPLYGQELLPSVNNYRASDYDGASQNWGVSSDSLGVIYVANNEGLLTYDGERWKKYTLPNETIIRSVFAYKGRIFTGSYEEFGFWEYDDYGDLDYTSLTGLIKTTFDNEEFWGITSYGGAIVFRSFGKLYKYADGKIISFKPDFLITSLVVNRGRLFVGAKNGQVYEFKNGTFNPLSDTGLPDDYSITSLAIFKDTLILGSRVGGLFTLRENKCVPWGPEKLNNFLIKNELNKVNAFGEDQLVFGTVKGGVETYNQSNGKLNNFHLGNGLQNNTVLALHASGDMLWVALDNGVDAIDLNAQITFYRDKTGELGAVYDIAFKDDKIYLGSNTGVHVLDDHGQHFIPGSQGQVWSFNNIGDHLYVNHNRGIFEIKDDQIIPVDEHTGSYALIPVPRRPDYYLDATYNGILLYQLNSGTLKYSKIIGETETPIKEIVFETENEVWAAHPYKGFFKIEFRDDFLDADTIRSYGKDSLLKAYKTNIYKLPGSAVGFYNAGNWFKYNGIKDSIEPFEEMKIYKGFSLISQDHGDYWLKNNYGPGFIYTDFKKDSLYIDSERLESRLVKGNSRAVKRNDFYYITLNEGFAAIDMDKLRKRYAVLSIDPPQLTGFHDRNKKYNTSDRDFELDHDGAARIIMQVSAPAINNSQFEYQLSSGESGRFREGNLILNNLTAGIHTLKIVTVINGKKSKEALIINLNVLPPWFLSIKMLVVYFLFLLLIIYLVYIINKKKLNKHRLAVEQKLSKEQERRMELAERNSLMDEIKNKRKELANSTFLAAQRNRALTEVKQDLKEVKDDVGNKHRLANIEEKIASLIEGKDHWRVFETNFKEINDTFFQELLKQHPKLSSKDLKLCAYLKMNLTTKEIAPLMAISPRGVEIHRYRLRKKLKLKTQTNLTKYLIEHY